MIVPVGLTGSTKTPGVANNLLYAQGVGGATLGEQVVVLQGYKSPSGVTATDYELFDVIDPKVAAEKVGVKSELGRMIRAAARIGARIKALATPEPSGGAAGTATITVTGTATAAGQFKLRFGSDIVTIPISSGDTATVVGDNVELYSNNIYAIHFTAANVTGTVTLTLHNKGARGNDHLIFIDKDGLAPGISVAVAGGTARANGGVPFTGGSGVETIATVLAATRNVSVQYSAWAAADATSADAIKTQAEEKAAPFDVGPENTILANTADDVADAIVISTAFNQFFGQVVWGASLPNHPSEIAAVWAVHRSVVEAAPLNVLGDPNHRYLNEPLQYLKGHYRPEESPGRATTEAAYNAGVTPLVTAGNRLAVQRSITSYWKDATDTPDYRVLDTSDSIVPQRVAKDVQLVWEREFSVNNPYVGPDLPDGELPPAGLATPTTWATKLNERMKLLYFPANLIRRYDAVTGEELVATAEYNATLKCLISDVPCQIVAKNFILGNNVRQIPS